VPLSLRVFDFTHEYHKCHFFPGYRDRTNERSLVGWDVRDISQPHGLRLLRREGAAEEVGRDGQIVFGCRSSEACVCAHGLPAHRAHQSLDPPSRRACRKLWRESQEGPVWPRFQMGYSACRRPLPFPGAVQRFRLMRPRSRGRPRTSEGEAA
jgi:hypothetical protein